MTCFLDILCHLGCFKILTILVMTCGTPCHVAASRVSVTPLEPPKSVSDMKLCPPSTDRNLGPRASKFDPNLCDDVYCECHVSTPTPRC